MATTTELTRPRAFRPEMSGAVGAATAVPGWDLATERRIDDGETLARQIGWFSIALGALELAAPERIAEYLGMDDKANVVRLYGVREIVQGVGVLSNRRPRGWIRVRIAGDALDLATLAAGLTNDNPRRGRVLGAIAMVAGVTLLDLMCERQLASARLRYDGRSDRMARQNLPAEGAR